MKWKTSRKQVKVQGQFERDRSLANYIDFVYTFIIIYAYLYLTNN